MASALADIESRIAKAKTKETGGKNINPKRTYEDACTFAEALKREQAKACLLYTSDAADDM
eukprot:12358909-Alexandrium_andersonii.AAC.1